MKREILEPFVIIIKKKEVNSSLWKQYFATNILQDMAQLIETRYENF